MDVYIVITDVLVAIHIYYFNLSLPLMSLLLAFARRNSSEYTYGMFWSHIEPSHTLICLHVSDRSFELRRTTYCTEQNFRIQWYRQIVEGGQLYLMYVWASNKDLLTSLLKAHMFSLPKTLFSKMKMCDTQFSDSTIVFLIHKLGIL